MKNSVLNKMISGTLITTMLMMSYSPCAMAKGFSRFHHADKLALNNTVDETILLKGDVALTTKDEKVSLSLKDSDVEQVLRMFADIAGMNIVFYETVTDKVTLDIVDMPVNEAFDMVLEMAKLTYNVMNGNTIVIGKAGTDISLLKKGITFIPVKYVEASKVADFLNKNVFGMKKPGLSGSDIVSINPVTNELMVMGTDNDVAIIKRVLEKFDKKPATTVFHVNYTTPGEMAKMVCDHFLPTAGLKSEALDNKKLASTKTKGKLTGAASGITLGESSEACKVESQGASGGNMTPFNLQSFSIFYQDQNGLINMIGGTEEQIAMVGDFIKKFDRKIPQAYLELSVIELTEDGSKSLTNTWQFYSKVFNFNTQGGNFTNSIPFWVFGKEAARWDIDSDTGIYTRTLIPKTIDYQGPSRATLMYNIDFSLENGKARTVANPRVLVTNGETASIDLTHTYIESMEIETVTAYGGALVYRKPSMGNAGIGLSVTPFISPDGYVTMDVSPNYTVVGRAITEIDPETLTEYVSATETSTRSFTLNKVRVKDGETLVIAGMISEDEQKHVSKIPFLGDIPYIGALFRSSSTQRSKSEMIVMITPKIVYDDEDL